MKTLVALLALCAAPLAARTTTAFDSDWRFFKGDPTGAAAADFNDSAWHVVRLPHDWSIEGPFDAQNSTGQGGGFLPAGAGWYRKRFTLGRENAGKRVFVEFDGVMANSEVWINGVLVGKRPYGYVSFAYDLTPHIKFGAPNVIAVRADNSQQPASRWYTGAGIYRHVRLIVTDPVHIGQWTTFVTNTKTGVRVQTTVLNQSDRPRRVDLEIVIDSPQRQRAVVAHSQGREIEPGKDAAFDEEVAIPNPTPWSLEAPALYRATVFVRERRDTLDDDTVTFGIREARFDADTGFWLNGKNFKIKGVCLHQDGGAFGAAVPLGVWERRLAALKQIGVNAIRTAHNPPAPEFLDLCDRMGFLVMDEMFDQWTVAKNPYDYHLYFREWSHRDTADSVRRDRNHPSVILYSAGNEIHDTPKADLAKEILTGLVKVFHENDPTRPVTQALFRPNVSHDYDNGLADLLDVVGQNYRENEIVAAHQQKPSRKIIGTENQHGRNVWVWLRDNAPYAGQFLWSGIDYLGEAGRWPNTTAGSGLLYRTGVMKPMAYERQSWWSDKPMVHITRRVAPQARPDTDPGYEAFRRIQQTLFDDWTPANQQPHEEAVETYSNCAEVELLLNGKSLGAKTLPADAAPRVWRVAWDPGVIQAVCRNEGQIAARHELHTAGAPAKIVLSPDRPGIGTGWDDVAFVSAQVVDDHGVVVPSASNKIAFTVSGPGAVAAVDNGENASHEPFQASVRSAWEGQCLAMVRATAAGRIVITAASEGIAPATAAIQGR
jgi:beta-galactosidase